VQGKEAKEAEKLLSDAKALADAGAGLLVLEMVPASLAREVTEAVPIITIGIGAGPQCDGQVLVLHDMLGIYGIGKPGYKPPRFVRNFMHGAGSMEEAIRNYVQAVKNGEFPSAEQSF
jgi:3-methyl-2-oxobutanoate hydroxymethyltransferase